MPRGRLWRLCLLLASGFVGLWMTSIERTAYPRFKPLITAHELNLFFSPSRKEVQWAADSTDSDEHQLALLLALKAYQRRPHRPHRK